jgi:hypothetical protein
LKNNSNIDGGVWWNTETANDASGLCDTINDCDVLRCRRMREILGQIVMGSDFEGRTRVKALQDITRRAISNSTRSQALHTANWTLIRHPNLKIVAVVAAGGSCAAEGRWR